MCCDYRKPSQLPLAVDGAAAGENSLQLEDNQFDSTGMFHWCPEQDIANCLIVSYRLCNIVAIFRVIKYRGFYISK